MDFATNFNRICKEKGTTPTALCKKLGISTSKVSMWNNGSLPKQEMLLTLAKALDCSVMDFFADMGDTPTKPSDQPLTEDEQDMLRIYRMLDRRSKHELMALVYRAEKKALSRDNCGTLSDTDI